MIQLTNKAVTPCAGVAGRFYRAPSKTFLLGKSQQEYWAMGSAVDVFPTRAAALAYVSALTAPAVQQCWVQSSIAAGFPSVLGAEALASPAALGRGGVALQMKVQFQDPRPSQTTVRLYAFPAGHTVVELLAQRPNEPTEFPLSDEAVIRHALGILRARAQHAS